MMNKPQIAPVTLEEYNPKWIEMFESEKQIITDAIGKYITSIEHIGSTSIEGLVAKPEIDILIGVVRLSDVDLCLEAFNKLGYVYYQHFEEFEPERRYFRKSDGIIPLVHIHIYEEASAARRERIVFRDYLRVHPEIRDRYAEHKLSLAKKFSGDRLEYSHSKNYFISNIIQDLKKDGLL